MMKTRDIVVIAYNIRSAHNIGSLLRTAEGLGGIRVILSGHTPFPALKNDHRLPHESTKVTKLIAKTALGAESSNIWQQVEDIFKVINQLRKEGFVLYALEQSQSSIALPDQEAPEKTAIILGNEVTGLDSEVAQLCDQYLEIPMKGQKESFNVTQAAAMALYELKFH